MEEESNRNKAVQQSSQSVIDGDSRGGVGRSGASPDGAQRWRLLHDRVHAQLDPQVKLRHQNPAYGRHVGEQPRRKGDSKFVKQPPRAAALWCYGSLCARRFRVPPGRARVVRRVERLRGVGADSIDQSLRGARVLVDEVRDVEYPSVDNEEPPSRPSRRERKPSPIEVQEMLLPRRPFRRVGAHTTKERLEHRRVSLVQLAVPEPRLVRQLAEVVADGREGKKVLPSET